ncbi:4a-hydroxytetrahydrobiopterin dehydratase [Ramlibacter sp.]|uniref:4a-hydroxytetrahydrobiopterin dehydratase n=1 Tax=Ramlibacter sp. TaxID=1917967 RepID=UPI003D0B9DF6
MTATQRPRALTATEIVTRLSNDAPGWKLSGDGDETGIEKSYAFANYHETMAFVNAVAFIAHGMDHHPDLSVHYNRCVVRYRTHDAKGITELDFEAAARVEALLA